MITGQSEGPYGGGATTTGDTKMTTAKKKADTTATEATKAAQAETFAERQTRETTEADNIVKGATPDAADAPKAARNLKTEQVEDEQTRINREVAELQKAKGSTASKTPGPKYKG